MCSFLSGRERTEPIARAEAQPARRNSGFGRCSSRRARQPIDRLQCILGPTPISIRSSGDAGGCSRSLARRSMATPFGSRRSKMGGRPDSSSGTSATSSARGELARFEREARTLSRLRHERCLSVVAFGTHEGRPFLVSDLPGGQDAAGRARQGRADGAPRCIAGPAALRGDSPPAPARRGSSGAAARKRVGAQSPAADLLKIGLPRIGQTAATADAARERFYLPPERSAARRDHRADLYAAGMLLYVMCTGREPTGEVVASTAGGAPVPPPRVVSPERGISDALERVILRAVAPSPDVRFGTADELIAALQSVGAHQTTPKRRPAPRPRKRTAKRTAMLATAFAAVALLGAGALRSSGGQGPSASPAAQAVSAPEPPGEDRRRSDRTSRDDSAGASPAPSTRPPCPASGGDSRAAGRTETRARACGCARARGTAPADEAPERQSQGERSEILVVARQRTTGRGRDPHQAAPLQGSGCGVASVRAWRPLLPQVLAPRRRQAVAAGPGARSRDPARPAVRRVSLLHAR